MLGKTIYYLNFKESCVTEGVVIDEHITSSGHGAYLVKTDKGLKQAEMSITYLTKEEAYIAFEEKQPIADKINEIVKDSNSRIEELRELIIGKPKFKELVNE